MAEEDVARRDLEGLSASAHTPESFGRAIIAATLAAAARESKTFESGKPIPMKLDLEVTPIRGVGAWVCVGVPGFGRICAIERDDTP